MYVKYCVPVIFIIFSRHMSKCLIYIYELYFFSFNFKGIKVFQRERNNISLFVVNILFILQELHTIWVQLVQTFCCPSNMHVTSYIQKVFPYTYTHMYSIVEQDSRLYLKLCSLYIPDPCYIKFKFQPKR